MCCILFFYVYVVDGMLIENSQVLTFFFLCWIGTGKTLVSGSLYLNTVQTKYLKSRDIYLLGDTFWLGGDVSLSDNATFTNTPHATFTISTTTNVAMTNSGSVPSQFYNYGTVEKHTTSITAQMLPDFFNYGEVAVFSGNLQIAAVGDQVDGLFVSNDPGTITFVGSYVHLSPSVTLDGSGVFKLTNYVDLVLFSSPPVVV